MRALNIIALFSVLFAVGCFLEQQPDTIVNEGDSAPVAEEDGGAAWERIRDRSPIAAYEAGRCETDADCFTQECGAVVCGSRGTNIICLDSLVGDCLREVEAEQCGCNEGVCRWTRSPQVMACAAATAERAESRPFFGAEGSAYPGRPGHPTDYVPQDYEELQYTGTPESDDAE